MRNFQATHNVIAVSAQNAEPAINTEATLDTILLSSLSDVANIEYDRFDNADERHGREEPSIVYEGTLRASMPLTFERAQAQHYALLLSYGLGNITTQELTNGGYEHVITPIEGEWDDYRGLPSMTVKTRHGKTVVQRKFFSMFVESVTASFARDDFSKLSAQINGTGKNETAMTQVYADSDTTTLTVTDKVHANDIESIHELMVSVDMVWHPVTITAVESDGGSGSNITIELLDSQTAGAEYTYRILYRKDEATMPSTPMFETPLFVSDVRLNIGGKWENNQINGGRWLDAEMKSVEYSLTNNLSLVTGFSGTNERYANRVFREGRTQTIKFDREFRDYIIQHYLDTNQTFSLYLKAEGDLFNDNTRFGVSMLFPRLSVLSAPLSIDGKKNAEQGDMVALDDGDIGSCRISVVNNIPKYASSVSMAGS